MSVEDNTKRECREDEKAVNDDEAGISIAGSETDLDNSRPDGPGRARRKMRRRTMTGVVALALLVVVSCLVVWTSGDGEFERTSLSTSESDGDTGKEEGSLQQDVVQDVSSANNDTESVEEDSGKFLTHNFVVLKEIDHDEKSFTQGLSYHDGILYESTGLYGRSKIRRIDAETGGILKSVDMDRKFFGEGMTFYGDGLLIQITWKERTGFVYDSKTLETEYNFTYGTTTNEGWGITYDAPNDRFVVTDGSDYLHFWDGKTLKETQRIKVKYSPDSENAGRKVSNLNEVEFWKGDVLSNEWFTDRIHRIDPSTGIIKETIDFKDLWPKSERNWNNDVFNGIATTDKENELFVTGKKWPKIYAFASTRFDFVVVRARLQRTDLAVR